MSMKQLFTIALLCMVTATSAWAGGNAEAGRDKSQPCQACHGENGESTASIYPKLAGQYEDYLVKALTDYRDGNRSNAIMAPFAAALSDQDIEDLAAWYSSQEGLKVVKP